MKMTRKKVIIVIIMCAVLLLAARIIYYIEKNGLTYSTGTCIVTDDGSYLIVFGDSPTSMAQRFGVGNIFSGLETGDEIGVVHGYIALTYPSQTSVYFCRKLEDGEPSNVSTEIIDSLNELGWKVSTGLREVQEEGIPDNLNVETFIWEDLDDNGIQEYLVVENNDNHEFGRITFYFNDEPVYQYEEEVNIRNVVSKEYIDLDNDNEKEIFVSFVPDVNSAGLMEWFALKKTSDGWKAMNDMAVNEFPISVTKGAEDYELIIKCEGTDKEIIFDATDYYDWAKREAEEYYNAFLNGNYKEGDEVGHVSDYGNWHIEVTRWGGQDCLVAEHGLQGPGGKHDIYGTAYVYFKFNSKSEIKILHLEFDKSFVPIGEKEGKIIMNRASDDEEQRYLELLCENGKVYGYIIDDSTELVWADPCALEAMKEQNSRSIRPFNEWRILGDGSIGFHVVAGEGRADAPEDHIGVHINVCPVEDWYYAETITVQDVPDSFYTP